MGWDLWNSSGCKSRIINVHQIIRRRIQQGLARIFVFALIPGVFETLNDGVINILDVSRRTQKIIQYLPVVAVKLVQDLEVKHIFPVAETTKRKNKKNYIYIFIMNTK